jgi:hypothetical protein
MSQWQRFPSDPDFSLVNFCLAYFRPFLRDPWSDFKNSNSVRRFWCSAFRKIEKKIIFDQFWNFDFGHYNSKFQNWSKKIFFLFFWKLNIRNVERCSNFWNPTTDLGETGGKRAKKKFTSEKSGSDGNRCQLPLTGSLSNESGWNFPEQILKVFTTLSPNIS